MGCEYCLMTNCPTCEEMSRLLREARAEADGRAAGDEPDLWDAGPRHDAIDWTGLD